MTKRTKAKTWRGPKVGEAVFIRTVTLYYTGRVIALDAQWIHLDEAAWIADSGRFGAAMAKGELSEVEPYPGPVSIARGAIVDCAPWQHPLARAVK